MKKLCFLCLLMLLCINSKAEDKRIALTFDDGPHTKYTLEILDILKENNATATFFIIGENAEEHPDIVEKIIKSGCEVGNHTWSHAFLDKLSSQDVYNELARADELLKNLTGESPRVFRPPGGRFNDTVLKIAEDFGYTTVLWSKDTRDWSSPGIDKVISSALDNPTDGDIILFHDYNARNSPTPEALRKILPKLIADGYKTVTVSELLK